ncbi:MAG TPA: hypothetical protein VG962_15730 [Steroidobacteraceae bacterium]|nr:hypothetical protein [Steroidobacteraceae bacterium]
MRKRTALVLAFIWLSSLVATAAESPVARNTDTIINLPVADTWKLFTTENGLLDIGYENVSMQLKLDEHIHAERKAGESAETIDATLTSFDPQHMISWRWSNDSACWSVLYFNAMGKEMTQIRWVDMCDSDQGTTLERASNVHRDLFNKLIRRYAPECHVCKEEREAAEKEKGN